MTDQIPVDQMDDASLTREAMRDELGAQNAYSAYARQTKDAKAKKVYEDISHEEGVHVGELAQTLSEQDPSAVKDMNEGREEVKTMKSFRDIYDTRRQGVLDKANGHIEKEAKWHSAGQEAKDYVDQKKLANTEMLRTTEHPMDSPDKVRAGVGELKDTGVLSTGKPEGAIWGSKYTPDSKGYDSEWQDFVENEMGKYGHPTNKGEIYTIHPNSRVRTIRNRDELKDLAKKYPIISEDERQNISEWFKEHPEASKIADMDYFDFLNLPDKDQSVVAQLMLLKKTLNDNHISYKALAKDYDHVYIPSPFGRNGVQSYEEGAPQLDVNSLITLNDYLADGKTPTRVLQREYVPREKRKVQDDRRTDYHSDEGGRLKSLDDAIFASKEIDRIKALLDKKPMSVPKSNVPASAPKKLTSLYAKAPPKQTPGGSNINKSSKIEKAGFGGRAPTSDGPARVATPEEIAAWEAKEAELNAKTEAHKERMKAKYGDTFYTEATGSGGNMPPQSLGGDRALAGASELNREWKEMALADAIATANAMDLPEGEIRANYIDALSKMLYRSYSKSYYDSRAEQLAEARASEIESAANSSPHGETNENYVAEPTTEATEYDKPTGQGDDTGKVEYRGVESLRGQQIPKRTKKKDVLKELDNEYDSRNSDRREWRKRNGIKGDSRGRPLGRKKTSFNDIIVDQAAKDNNEDSSSFQESASMEKSAQRRRKAQKRRAHEAYEEREAKRQAKRAKETNPHIQAKKDNYSEGKEERRQAKRETKFINDMLGDGEKHSSDGRSGAIGAVTTVDTAKKKDAEAKKSASIKKAKGRGIMSQAREADKQRRKVYGRAGDRWVKENVTRNPYKAYSQSSPRDEGPQPTSFVDWWMKNHGRRNSPLSPYPHQPKGPMTGTTFQQNSVNTPAHAKLMRNADGSYGWYDYYMGGSAKDLATMMADANMIPVSEFVPGAYDPSTGMRTGTVLPVGVILGEGPNGIEYDESLYDPDTGKLRKEVVEALMEGRPVTGLKYEPLFGDDPEKVWNDKQQRRLVLGKIEQLMKGAESGNEDYQNELMKLAMNGGKNLKDHLNATRYARGAVGELGNNDVIIDALKRYMKADEDAWHEAGWQYNADMQVDMEDGVIRMHVPKFFDRETGRISPGYKDVKIPFEAAKDWFKDMYDTAYGDSRRAVRQREQDLKDEEKTKQIAMDEMTSSLAGRGVDPEALRASIGEIWDLIPESERKAMLENRSLRERGWLRQNEADDKRNHEALLLRAYRPEFNVFNKLYKKYEGNIPKEALAELTPSMIPLYEKWASPEGYPGRYNERADMDAGFLGLNNTVGTMRDGELEGLRADIKDTGDRAVNAYHTKKWVNRMWGSKDSDPELRGRPQKLDKLMRLTNPENIAKNGAGIYITPDGMLYETTKDSKPVVNEGMTKWASDALSYAINLVNNGTVPYEENGILPIDEMKEYAKIGADGNIMQAIASSEDPQGALNNALKAANKILRYEYLKNKEIPGIGNAWDAFKEYIESKGEARSQGIEELSDRTIGAQAMATVRDENRNRGGDRKMLRQVTDENKDLVAQSDKDMESQREEWEKQYRAENPAATARDINNEWKTLISNARQDVLADKLREARGKRLDEAADKAVAENATQKVFEKPKPAPAPEPAKPVKTEEPKITDTVTTPKEAPKEETVPEKKSASFRDIFNKRRDDVINKYRGM